jgi:hypothetical protein
MMRPSGEAGALVQGRAAGADGGGALFDATDGSAPGLPRDFGAGALPGTSLVDPGRVASTALDGAGGAGATQAAGMARAFAVTSTPGASVLPLVAPAAKAVAQAAAAKPLSETIAGAGDPSIGKPALGASPHDGGESGADGQGRAQDGRSSASVDVKAQQDVNALAMKIARSVMLRMRRERERRGIHG